MFSFNFLVPMKSIFAACHHLYMEFKIYCIFILKYHRTAKVALSIKQLSISALEFKFQLCNAITCGYFQWVYCLLESVQQRK